MNEDIESPDRAGLLEQLRLAAERSKQLRDLRRLTGTLTGTVNHPDTKTPRATGPSCFEMTVAAARAFHAKYSTGHVGTLIITLQNLKETAREMFPESASRLRTGVYAAVQAAKKKGILKICPGGMELVGMERVNPVRKEAV